MRICQDNCVGKQHSTAERQLCGLLPALDHDLLAVLECDLDHYLIV